MARPRAHDASGEAANAPTCGKTPVGADLILRKHVRFQRQLLMFARTSIDHLRAEISDLRREVGRMAGKDEKSANSLVASADSHSASSDGYENADARNVRRRMTVEPEIDAMLIAGSPTYRGPTSAEFSFHIAGKDLEPGPDSPLEVSHQLNHGQNRETTGFSSELLADRPQIVLLVLNDPLWIWEPSEVRDLIADFVRGPGALYPLVNSTDLLKTYEGLLHTLKQAKRAFPESTARADYGMMRCPAAVTLKLVIAIASVVKSCGINRKVQYLFESIRTSLGRSFWGLPNLTNITNWVLIVS